MRNKSNFIILPLIFLLVILGCDGNQTEEMIRGRIKYVVTREHRDGSHGWGSWEIINREFYVNGKKWSPEAFDLGKIEVRCYASPNKSIEAFKCDGFSDKNEFTAVLRMKGDAPEWVTASESPAVSGNTFGEWFGNGGWIVFKNYFYNVETGEKRAIKELPGDPKFYFGAVSPDMKTIVYMGIICFDKNKPVVDEIYAKVCEQRNEYEKNNMRILWLIDADTGAATHLEVNYDKYPWAAHPTIFYDDRLKEFQEKIVWEIDETGRDRLVYPN